MPISKTAGPTKKPFEVRVGLGFPQFRGMRTVSDAINTPPNHWRYLQNVRLGMDGVESRPGLGAFDDPMTTVNGMAEMDEEIQAATLYAGPYPRPPWAFFKGTAPAENQTVCYWRVDLSKIPSTFDAGFNYFTAIIESSASFIIAGREVGGGGPNSDTWARGPLAIANAAPYQSALTVGWGSNGDVPGDQANGLNFYQLVNCMDALVLFEDKWLAAGQLRGDFDASVGDFAPAFFTSPTGSPPPVSPATGDPLKGGQTVVEINFDTSKKLDREVLTGHTPGEVGILHAAYGGGLTAVMKLPAPGYKFGTRTPDDIAPGFSDPTHYPNGRNWIRSMAVVRERLEDGLSTTGQEFFTNDELGERTEGDILYIGTAGGNVKIVGPFSARDWGINDETIGDVYSFDGRAVKLETTGVGMLVCVAATPDGGILAAGASAAKFKAKRGATWAAVTYSPVPTVPTSSSANLNEEVGYFWFDRVVFRGQIYLIGADRGQAILAASNRLLNRPARLVIARFDVPTLTITIIRRGDVFSQVSGDNLVGGVYEDNAQITGVSPPWGLATDGGLLYYLNHWVVGTSRTYVGTYDGTVFDDDAFVTFDSSLGAEVLARNIVAAGGAIYVCNNLGNVWKIVNGAITFLATGGSTISAKVFVGP